MHNFEYDIKLNELGEPYIFVPENVENKPEHKFMFMEMTRMLLFNFIKSVTIKNDKNLKTISQEDKTKIVNAFNVISQLSDEIGMLYLATKDIENEIDGLLNNNNDV